MNSSNCLNCNEKIHRNFCEYCGQKSETHRITLHHFIMHDLLHGVWHFEKGIFFTLKQAIVRPGEAALDYISGKRIRYYNVFYLSLLLIGLSALLLHWQHLIHADTQQNNATGNFISNYAKWFLLGIIPIVAINGKLVFLRLRMNFAEHLILSGFCLTGMLLFGTFFVLLNFVLYSFESNVLLQIQKIVFYAILIFPLWSYANAASNRYSKLGISWRLILFLLLVFAESMLILWYIVYIKSGGTGEVQLSL